MNKNLLSLFTILCITLGLISCKKDKEEELTRKQLLTAQAWKLNKVLAFNNEVTDENALQAIESFQNSSFLFKADGTFTATDNSSGATTSGTWELQENDTKLFIKFSTTSYIFTIKTLTASELNLTTPFSVPDIPIPVEVELQMIPAK